jgi:hypothetical protein
VPWDPALLFLCPNTPARTFRRSSGRREPLAATAAPLAAVGPRQERSAVGIAAEGSRALEQAPRPTVPCLGATESVSAEEMNAQPRRLVIASIVRDPAWRPTLGPDNSTFRMVDLLLFALGRKAGPARAARIGSGHGRQMSGGGS